jgi:hypothetical protein
VEDGWIFLLAEECGIYAESIVDFVFASRLGSWSNTELG